jgi:hypothetical protein
MSARTEFNFRYDKAAFNRARHRILALSTRAQNVTPAWNVFLDWFTDGNRKQFGTQGKHWRTPWRELKPGTVARKRYEGWMGDILVRSGDLRRAVSDRPLQIERIGPHDMSAGTRLGYANYHHRGAPRANIPKRPLWNARAITQSGAATSAVKSWIISGAPRVSERKAR